MVHFRLFLVFRIRRSRMQIIVTLMGADRFDRIATISRVVRDCKCTILESRMTELGAEFAGHMLVEGNWNHIVKLENALENLSPRGEFKVHTMRAREAPPETENVLPYAVDVVAGENSNHLHELAEFFASRHIKVVDASTSRYPAPYSGTPMFLAHLIVKIPTDMKIISLRDEFLEFCDQQNLDAILEPVKR